MKRAQHLESRAPVSRVEIALTTWIIPLMSAVLITLGWVLLDRYRDGLTVMDADLAVALTAAVSGVVLAAWWFGGVFMLACAATARRCEWHRVERLTTRLTPRLIVRTAGAVVGIHLVTVSAAHATEPVNPFWSDSEAGVSQVDHSEPAASVEAPSDDASAPPPETSSEAAPEQAPSGAEQSGSHNTSPSPAVTDLPAAAGPAASAVGSADVAAPLHAPDAVPAPHRVTDSTLTVVQGDTLWDITAQFLGPQATPAQIAAQTATWLEHNDLEYGGDLIRPGDQLQVPPHLLGTPTSALPTEGASS